MAIDILTGLGHSIFIVVPYALIGAGIKYIDQAFDIGVFNKKIAIFLSIPVGIIMATLMILDPSSATIFFAIVLSVAIGRKIDTIAFKIGVFILILFPIIFQNWISIQWLPFGILVLSGILDEWGNDTADRMNRQKLLAEAKGDSIKTTWTQLIFYIFFENRFMMKVAIIVLTILGYLRLIYLIAFFAFDISYMLIERYSISKKVYSISRMPLATNNNIRTTSTSAL